MVEGLFKFDGYRNDHEFGINSQKPVERSRFSEKESLLDSQIPFIEEVIEQLDCQLSGGMKATTFMEESHSN